MSAELSRDHDTRERILAAGAELFAQKGFHGCGLNEVLQRANVPKGSFYHYFASKEEFGVALIERTRDGYLADVKPILGDRKLTPLKRLRRMFELGREECQKSGPEQQCLISKLALENRPAEPLGARRGALRLAAMECAARAGHP